MYSIDYKKRAVEYKHEGHTFKELEEAFRICNQTYYRWAVEYMYGFEKPEPKERTCKIDMEQLKQAIEEKPDAYLRELAEPYGVTEQAVFYALRRLDITLKKKLSHTPKNPRKRGRAT
jgi:transposase